MNIVSGYWKSIDGSVTYGYCTCGREVNLPKREEMKNVLCVEQKLCGIWVILGYGLDRKSSDFMGNQLVTGMFFEEFLYDFIFLKNRIFDWCNRLVTRWYLL